MPTLYPAGKQSSVGPTLASMLVARGRRAALMFALLLTLGGFAALVSFERSGAVECARTSQLQLQFVWTQTRMDTVLACWGKTGRRAVARGLVADYVFIAGYVSLLLTLAMRLGAAARAAAGTGWRWATFPAAAAAVAAGFLDVVENLAIWAVLNGATADPLGLAIGLLASVKFALVAVCVVLVVIAWLRLWRKATLVGEPAGDNEREG